MSIDTFKADTDKTIAALKRLLKGRADAYEVFISSDSGLGVEAKEGSVDALKARSSSGAGLRIINKKRQGFGFSSVLSEDALKDLVDKTIAGSLEVSGDEFLKFASPEPSAVTDASLGVFDPSYGTASEDEKIRKAVSIEESAKAFDPRIKRVRKASYSESLHFERIVNSNGVDVVHAATYCSGSVTAVAEQGAESQMGWEIGMGHEWSSVKPEEIGAGAAKNAVRLLGARKIETIKCPAVIENTVVSELLESLAGSLLGDIVQKGKSMIGGKIGEKVASSVVNIYDDGVLRGGWASSAYDGEGAKKARTALIVEGVLQGYLYDTYWAGRAGARPTGNAARSGYKGYPTVGISNLYIEKGVKSFDELIKDLGEGLFITEVLGGHTINAVSGDFSLGAAGFRVEGGNISYPVRGIAIAGNLLELFLKIGACASDIRFIGSIGAPSILINELEASGS